MKLDNFLIQLAILFLPRVVWARLDASWARQNKPSDTEFFVRAFLFGVISYVVTFGIYSILGYNFELVRLDNGSMLTSSIVTEIVVATAVGFVFSIIWIYASTHKWVARMLQAIGATKRFGDEDVWDFTFNSKATSVEFVHVRDFDQRVVYAGYVNAFSEREALRELVLRDVTVYDFDGNTMYDVPLLNISRRPEGLHIEFPYRSKDDHNDA